MKQGQKGGDYRPKSAETERNDGQPDQSRYGWLLCIILSVGGLAITVVGIVTGCAIFELKNTVTETLERLDGSDPGRGMGGLTPGELQIFLVIAAVIAAVGAVMAVIGIVSSVKAYRKRKNS